MTIDMVIPFVDNSDMVWRKMYLDYCKYNHLTEKIVEINTIRFEDKVKLINYQLKLINKNMPFINKIYLLLSNYEQQPKDLPSNVVIKYHPNFIPRQYLPTFNSTTIEMFIWNIKELSEYFIYANDDMLPMKPLKESDFFTEDGKVKIEWWEEDIRQLNNTFRQQCYNSYNHTMFRLHKPYDKFKYYRPAHSFTPMIKSHCEKAFTLLEDVITKHIRAFRTVYQYNQYIYPTYEKAKYGTCESNIDFLYTQLKDGIDLDHDIVCVNVIPTKYEQELKDKLEKLL